MVAALEKKGIVEIYDNPVYRTPKIVQGITEQTGEIVLTDEQQKAYDGLLSSYGSDKGETSLLYGVTGSGKTGVFMKLIDRAVEDGKGIIVMVPEISLTPQVLSRFQSRYGRKIAVFHSGLSVGERRDEYLRVKRGEAQIAIGTRSAVFAPFENLGLIVIDEEQESTYKSEMTPRYDARSVARYRCAYHKALLVLSSATPSVESFTYAMKGKYGIQTIRNRYGNARLPDVLTVDLRVDRAQGNKYDISSLLLKELEKNLEEGRQSILLINRRGYNTFLACNSCGHVLTCPSCSISLTYHHANRRMMCHYCGYSAPVETVCPECGKEDIRYSGYGTQKIEDELSQLLPAARVLRMDTDSTLSRFSHESKLAAFEAGEYDILLGTQMVAKGLDFENVTLVGVVSADQQLNNDDFRSMERTFDLLTQVVGRAGRGNAAGRAVIQTLTPENSVIRLAAKQDYDAFYENEIEIRRFLKYPPFCDICAVTFISKDEAKASLCSKLFLKQIEQLCADEYADVKLIVLGPMPPRVAKISEKFRFRLIIKCRNDKRFRAMMSFLLTDYGKKREFSDVTVTTDMNPSAII
ncbi:MAG: primosomal protein N' [Clostridia bacterium]|nr:primosomal protein N' [Clostridia bacterium]